MGYEPFSVRRAAAGRQGQPVIYRYDELPQQFRNQVVRILDDVIGRERPTRGVYRTHYDSEVSPGHAWKLIYDRVSFEHGLDQDDTPAAHARSHFIAFFMDESAPVEHLLDAIEFAFRLVVRVRSVIDEYQESYLSTRTAEDGVEVLNHRFQRNALGYVFNGETLERVDSQFLHAEVVDPALQLLNATGFDGAEREFLSAHEHYRHGRNEEALVDALKSFESTMKHICNHKGWSCNANDTASQLVSVIVQNNLIPSAMESQLSAVRTILQSGLPTLRNRNAGHGQGGARRVVPNAVAAFGLHMAAANIVFLVECFKETES